MPRAKKVIKAPEPEVVQVEAIGGFKAQLTRYEGLLKVIAGIVGSVGVIYAALWAIGFAPMTNAKTVEIVDEHIKNHKIEFAQNIEKNFDGYDKRMKELEGSVKVLNDSASRVDERTRTIQEEQRGQRDLSNKILMELQRQAPTKK